MPNMNVRFSRGNYALQTLCREISSLWGYPSRPYEFVTGYLSATNFTGHNADANGVVHGVDIFVGPGKLTNGQADVLTSFLRREGLKGGIPGHPDRLYYIIYQDRIAGDFSNWEWVGAGYGHWDHVHVSTCDLFWGDPAPISALDYDSTAPWGLSAITGQGSGFTPITEEGFLMGLSDDDQIEVRDNMRKIVGWIDEIKGNVAPIQTASGPVQMRQFIADGTRASQAAAKQTADIITAQGPVPLRQFVADGTRAAQRLEPIVVGIAEAVTAPDVDDPTSIEKK